MHGLDLQAVDKKIFYPVIVLERRGESDMREKKRIRCNDMMYDCMYLCLKPRQMSNHRNLTPFLGLGLKHHKYLLNQMMENYCMALVQGKRSNQITV